jgi:deoxyribose-phosphate aldolase
MESCIRDGSVEIDMVMNIGYFKDGNLNYVANEIVQMVNSASGNILKVIIETNLLNEAEISQASKLVEDSGAQFVKTSTGFCGSGATPELVRLIRSAVCPETGIKASGGIKTLKQVEEIIGAGANRIGTSSGVIIMKEFSQKRFKFNTNLNDKFE